MPKQLPINAPVANERKLTGINISIHPFERSVSATFQFSHVAAFADGTKTESPGRLVRCSEEQMGGLLTDELWAAVSALAHGLADAEEAPFPMPAPDQRQKWNP